MSELIPLPETLVPFLCSYLPHETQWKKDGDFSRPFVTLTYAQSLDSRISLSSGVQTVISHAETKTMTHYIRSKHDAILVGVKTVVADDPGLNCRYVSQVGDDVHSIRPVVVDPNFKWFNDYQNSKLHKLYLENKGLPAWIIIGDHVKLGSEHEKFVQQTQVKIIQLPISLDDGKISWLDILHFLRSEKINSVMVEGGATVINKLLTFKPVIVDSLIITVGPVFLGSQGVEVSPNGKVNLKNVKWWNGIQDSVIAATIDN
ncbi:hypothetical protein PACTADRAFT_50830 [Pachysolen tannophilus NRRL Y-2460]|uniref:2,5-diamino-6-ribosylamino-4(3H)-pyrimidinone 5'-phosphate reductase n=1 Tax=Pachysolen tannophilus NRRL Y-2460 TaxID=669874 RepID=A0A1E4TT82_PACTA|nr:hypothetical protein PACTADRAFT_50830 [Pachysolen tannophilus NRRL Y-2460]